MRVLVLIIVLLLIVGALPVPYSSDWGYYTSGGLGLVLLVGALLVLVGVI